MDGLVDDAEVQTYHTLPIIFDTDGDRVGDGDEILDGTDPLNPTSSSLEVLRQENAQTQVIFGSTDKHAWYLARISGITAFILLTLVTCFGLIVSSRTLRVWFRPATSYDTHRVLAFLALAMVILHFSSLLFDQYLHLNIFEALIPFYFSRDFTTTVGFKLAPAVAMGVVALYGIIILTFTAELRAKLPTKWWRVIHYASFIAYPLFVAHGFLSGTDSKEWWMLVLYGVSVVMVITLIVMRIRYRNVPIQTAVPVHALVASNTVEV